MIIICAIYNLCIKFQQFLKLIPIASFLAGLNKELSTTNNIEEQSTEPFITWCPLKEYT